MVHLQNTKCIIVIVDVWKSYDKDVKLKVELGRTKLRRNALLKDGTTGSIEDSNRREITKQYVTSSKER